MTIDDAIATLTEKLPPEFEFMIDRAAGRCPAGGDNPGGGTHLAPFDRVILSIECWGRFEARAFEARPDQLDQAVGDALDAVATWKEAGEPYLADVGTMQL